MLLVLCSTIIGIPSWSVGWCTALSHRLGKGEHQRQAGMGSDDSRGVLVVTRRRPVPSRDDVCTIDLDRGMMTFLYILSGVVLGILLTIFALFLHLEARSFFDE